jgi:hypothetical protein
MECRGQKSECRSKKVTKCRGQKAECRSKKVMNAEVRRQNAEVRKSRNAEVRRQNAEVRTLNPQQQRLGRQEFEYGNGNINIRKIVECDSYHSLMV